MFKLDWKATSLLFFLCAPLSAVSAQWDSSTPTDPNLPATTVAPQPPPAPSGYAGSPTLQEPKQKKQEKGVRFTWAFDLGVPIFLDVDSDIVRPGADLSWFGGADFGWFVIGGAIGGGWNPVRLNNIPGTNLSGREPLKRIFFSIPELRFQVPSRGRVLPYLSGSFDMNLWNFLESQLGCGWWYCTAVAKYRFTPGFTGRVGLGIGIKGGSHIDVGLKYSFSGEGDFFERSHWWLSPYVGFLMRGRPK